MEGRCMKLDLKKNLAAKTLKVGRDKVQFDNTRLDEIKEAITRQDIRDLLASNAIKIKENKGRKTNVKRNNRRRTGKVKMKVKTRKQDYVKMTRKLRAYIKELKKQGKMDVEEYKDKRKKIRNKIYKSKRNLKEHLVQK